MKKVLFVATVVKTHIMQFHIPYLKMFKEMGWETAVAARNDYDDSSECNIPYCDRYYNIPFERSPLKPANIKAYKQLKKIIDTEGFDIIHCHTPVGGVIGRLAAKKARKTGTKVFYTAHGFHFFKGAPIINWLIYYPAEKLCAYYTDVLITINKEDYALAQSKMHAKKVVYVPGVGIDADKFADVQVDRDAKRKELGIPEDAFVIISVGELIARKNHAIVIDALKGIINDYPETHYIICGQGALENTLKQKCSVLGISGNVHFMGYRNDIAEIYKCSDLFVFPSNQEGLPVALMEAMACGLPVVCSRIRGNTDLVEDGVGGYLFCSSDTSELTNAVVRIRENSSKMKEMGLKNSETVKEFDSEIVNKKMKEIYNEG